MGIVYLGRDGNGDLVAVKVAHARLVGDEESGPPKKPGHAKKTHGPR
jgi:hypothetical protein